MKKIITTIAAVIILLGIDVANATITNVSILPNAPTSIEPITIIVNGIEGGGGVQITNTDFFVNGNSLTLDIYLDIGIAQVVTPWSHNELIGTLPVGTYDITVRGFLPSYYPPPLYDSYSMSFEVTPEPSTLAIFGFALPIFRYFTRRKI